MVIHTHAEYYSDIKNEIVPFVLTVWKNQESGMPSEVSQAQGEKYCMLSLAMGSFFKVPTI